MLFEFKIGYCKKRKVWKGVSSDPGIVIFNKRKRELIKSIIYQLGCMQGITTIHGEKIIKGKDLWVKNLVLYRIELVEITSKNFLQVNFDLKIIVFRKNFLSFLSQILSEHPSKVK